MLNVEMRAVYMPYNFVADSIHTKKLYCRLSSSEVQFYTENGCFAFLARRLWGVSRPSGCRDCKVGSDWLLCTV